MDFGAVFPTTQIGSDPAVIRDFAQTAEGLGYRRLTVYGYHGVPRTDLGTPAAHIAALGEFTQVVHGA